MRLLFAFTPLVKLLGLQLLFLQCFALLSDARGICPRLLGIWTMVKPRQVRV